VGKEQIFVIQDRFYKSMLRAVHKDSIFPKRYNFIYRGKKVLARSALMYWAIDVAESEVRSSKNYRDKITERAIEISKEYKWIKCKRKWSRCGKWIKDTIKRGSIV